MDRFVFLSFLILSLSIAPATSKADKVPVNFTYTTRAKGAETVGTIVNMSPKQVILAQEIFSKFMKVVRDERGDMQAVYPVGFKTIVASEISTTCKGYGAARELTSILEYRNSVGDAYGAKYRVCIISTLADDHPTFLLPDSEGPLVDLNVKFVEKAFSRERRDDNDCNIDTPVTLGPYCLEGEGAELYNFQYVQKTQSSQSRLESVLPTPNRPGCVTVKFQLKGGGRDLVGSCKESAWFEFSLNLKGTAPRIR